MSSVRLIAWNCHHGSLSTRLAELAAFAPAIVFLQECKPTETLPLMGPFLTQRVNARKGIALASLNADYHLEKLRARANRGRAVMGATVSGTASFTALGIWSQGPRYVDDVMRTLHAYDRVLRAGPAIVMGDLNSGTILPKRDRPTRGIHESSTPSPTSASSAPIMHFTSSSMDKRRTPHTVTSASRP